MKKRNLYLVGALVILVVILAVIGISGISSGKSGTIPVVTLDGECLNDYTNWNDKSTYYPATLKYTDGKNTFTMNVEIKPQGTSSMAYPKKNFTIKFAEDVELVEKWGAQKKYVLKADYIDPTNSGNVVSAKLAAEMNQKYGVLEDTPNYGVIDGFPVFVKINGEDAGTFSLTIPKDTWMLNMDGDNPNHLLLACEGWSDACSMRGYNIDFEADWTFEVGEATQENMAAFTRVVQFVATADDETFVRDFDQYLDLDACINYICFANASFAVDNVTKNMLMATYDGKVWYPVLYDLDTLWGIDWMGTGLSEVYHSDKASLLTDGNNLLYRVTRLFGDQVLERYQELRQGILSREHIIESFEDYTAQIPQEYYDINNALWYTEGTHIRTIELMGQLMDEYLPLMDQNMVNATSAPAEAADTGDISEAPAEMQNLVPESSLVHYVWESNGVQHSVENVKNLPVATTITYTLDGKEISAEDLAGKSGKLEATLRVERQANGKEIYGVAAVVQLDSVQCKNITVTGGIHTKSTKENATVCTGSAWLSETGSLYEMKLTMDVTNFEPAQYVVVINPMSVNVGGGDGALEALLATASELTTIVNDGITLHTSLVEWNTYLTNVHSALAGTGTLLEGMVPNENAEQENAGSVMKGLLADAEADADALLAETFGYQVAANMTSEARAKLLSQAAADAKRTEAERAQAAELLSQIEKYLVVVSQLQKNQEAAAGLNETLKGLTSTMSDLTGAYAYANDNLYSVLYRISTLYQNIANFYASMGGDGAGLVGYGAWNDVIIFTNHQ